MRKIERTTCKITKEKSKHVVNKVWVFGCVNVSVSMSSWERMGSPFLVHHTVRDRTQTHKHSPYPPPLILYMNTPTSLLWFALVSMSVDKGCSSLNQTKYHFQMRFPCRSTWITQKVLFIIDNDHLKYIDWSWQGLIKAKSQKEKHTRNKWNARPVQ